MTRDGVPVKLTSHEFRVLSYLMHHRNRVVSQSELTEHIYAQDFDRESNTVEVFIARLRRKLGPVDHRDRPRPRLPDRAMTPSLRRRILVGSIFWTIGMIFLASAVFSKVMELHHAMGFNLNLHAWLQAPLTLLTAALCMVVGVLQVRRGLAPVDNLRSRLAGRAPGAGPAHRRRIPGRDPAARQRPQRRCSSIGNAPCSARSPRPATLPTA